MKTKIDRQELLQLIYAHLDIVPDNILEEVLELLEEEKDLIDYDLAMEDIKINGTVPWEELIKRNEKGRSVSYKIEFSNAASKQFRKLSENIQERIQIKI